MQIGNAVTLVTQYDVETFKRIEELIGKQLNAYDAEEKEILLLLPQVEAAEKLAQDEIRDEEQKEKEKKMRKNKRMNNGKFSNNDTAAEKDPSMNFVKKQKVKKRSI